MVQTDPLPTTLNTRTLGMLARRIEPHVTNVPRTAPAPYAVMMLWGVFLAGCSGSSTTGGSSSAPVSTYSATTNPATLTFSTPTGIASTAQTVMLTNSGSGALTLTGPVLSGAGSGGYAITANSCGTSSASVMLAPSATCSVSLALSATSGGTFAATLSFSGNLTNSPQVTLTGATLTSATAANTADCSVTGGTCAPLFNGTNPTGQLPSDPIAAGGFHGYADPSIRKDPNSSAIYLAYSWAKSLTDGTHVVDLHLASSANGGSTWSEVGTLYQSVQTTQTSSTAYSSTDDSSTETVDLLPIPLTGASAGQTLWVQAHQSYLVAPKGGIYDQLNATNLISVTAVQLTSPALSGVGAALLALSSAPEGRLGAAGTDASRNVTQTLTTLSASTLKCANWGQPALWYQTGTLYLALECTEFTGNGQVDGNELAHFVHATTPSGTDASKWIWGYVGEFTTAAQAAKLGTAEGASYSFFTEPEFVATKNGLAILATPGAFAPQTSQQPVIQYGCRVIPVALTPTSVTLDTDATTGGPVVTATITEKDLYTGVNEGPAACTYDSDSSSGVIMGRKYENDPTYGFYIYPLATGINP